MPACSAAKAAWRRPCWWPRRRRRLRLPRSDDGRLRPDRPRRQGPQRAGPVDGFVYTDRGVYRPGEAVHLTALVRDAPGKAAALPVTLIVSRPDGVEHSRVALTDQGLGGRAITLPLAVLGQTGTWRAKVHTDPKAPDRAGLVPGRGLRARAAGAQARGRRRTALTPAGAGHHQGHRPLSLRPAGRRPRHRRRDRRQAVEEGRAGLRRLPVRPGRRADQPGAQAAGEAARHRRRRQGRDRRRPAGGDARPTGRSKPTSSCGCANPAAAPSSAPSRCPST